MERKRERAKEKDEKDSSPLWPPAAMGQRRKWKLGAEVDPCGCKERPEVGALRAPGLPLRALAVAGGSPRLKRAQYPTPLLPTSHHCGWLHGTCSPPSSLPSWASPLSFGAGAALLPSSGLSPQGPSWAQSWEESLDTWVLAPALPLCGLGQVTVPLWAVSKMVDISQVVLCLGLSRYLIPAELCGTVWRALILESIEGFTS